MLIYIRNPHVLIPLHLKPTDVRIGLYAQRYDTVRGLDAMLNFINQRQEPPSFLIQKTSNSVHRVKHTRYDHRSVEYARWTSQTNCYNTQPRKLCTRDCAERVSPLDEAVPLLRRHEEHVLGQHFDVLLAHVGPQALGGFQQRLQHLGQPRLELRQAPLHSNNTHL